MIQNICDVCGCTIEKVNHELWPNLSVTLQGVPGDYDSSGICIDVSVCTKCQVGSGILNTDDTFNEEALRDLLITGIDDRLPTGDKRWLAYKAAHKESTDAT